MAEGDQHRRRVFDRFGGVTQTKEMYREVRAFLWLECLRRDVGYAMRSLRKSPAFSTAAVATLALAIGANTAMFSVLDAVVLRPLPYRSPEQLAMLWSEDPRQNLRERRSTLSDVEQWRRQSQSFVDLASYDTVGTTLIGTDGPQQIVGVSISPNLLTLLGVAPIRGRRFSDEEAERGQPLVLISHRFWQTRFGGSDDAIGARLVLDGLSSEIIGILPVDFQVAGLDGDVWKAHPRRWLQSERGPATWHVIGRLRPGVTVEQAQAEMSAVSRHLNDQRPVAEGTTGISITPLSLHLVGRQTRLALWMLGGAVLCVFLIAAANVTSLSLARSAARTREMALRAAIGASTGRIVRQLLTESLVLAACAGLVGVALASTGIHVVRAFGPDNLPRLRDVSLDLRVLGWAMLVSATAGVIVGLAPAIATVRRDLRAAFEEGGRNSPGGMASRLRRALVVAEFALAIVLLVGAGLLVRSWWNVSRVDVGFEPGQVLMATLSSPPTFDAHVQRAALYGQVLERIQAVPGVVNAGIMGDLFVEHSKEHTLTIEGDGGTGVERLQLGRDEASAQIFTTLRTPLLRGRLFSASDAADAPRVAIINDTMARRSWPDRNPVGRRFKLTARESEGPWYTVIGVVGDIRRQGPEREPFPQMFESLTQSSPRRVNLFVRTSTDGVGTMAGALRDAVRRVDRNASLDGIAPLEDRLGGYLAQRRFQTGLLLAFAGVAMVMAAVGIYGLIQYSIAIRTQEIGVRMAIGARATDIFRMTVGEGLRLSLAGLAIGLVSAWWLGRAVSSLLFGLTANDPLTFAAVSLLLTAVAIAACVFPALRAMRVEPIVALRLT